MTVAEQSPDVVADEVAEQPVNAEVSKEEHPEAASEESVLEAEPVAAAEATDVSLEPWVTLVGQTGSDEAEEVARYWRDSGIDLDLASRWIASGIGPEVVRALVDAGFQPGEAEEWLRTGIQQTDWSKWKQQGFSVGEAGRWFSGGCPQAFLARRWLNDGVDAEDASLWIAGGLSSPHETKPWTRANWSGQDSSRWLAHGWRSPKVAALWQEAGFEPEEAQRWNAVGMRDIDLAASLFVEGTTPEDVAALADTAAPPALIADWLLAGPTMPAELTERRRDWCIALVGPREAERWSAVGVGSAEVRTFEVASLPLGRVEAWWQRYGISGLAAKRLIDAGLSPSELDAWFADGYKEVEIAAWRGLGVTPVEARAWSAAGVGDPDRCALWLAAGATATSVQEWPALGLYEPDDVEAWTSSGVDVTEAAEWLHLGMSAGDARRWREAGEKPASVSRWLAVGVNDADAALAWVSRGLRPDAAQRWLARGYSAGAASRWIEAGIVEVDQAVDWVENGLTFAAATEWASAGYAPSAARSWSDAGFGGPGDADAWRSTGADPAAAKRWASKGISPGAASEWSRAGISDPGVAETWTRVKVAPGEAQQWIVQGFTAASWAPWTALGIGAVAAGRWREHGFIASDTASWLAVDVAPDIAAYLKERALGPSTVTSLRDLDVTADDLHSWVRSGWRGESLVAIRQALSDPARRTAWRRSGIPIDNWPQWIPVVNGDAKLAAAWRDEKVSPTSLHEAIQQTGLDPRQLGLWIAAGSTGPKMINAHRRGERRPPAPPINPSWLAAGHEWITSAGLTPSDNNPILRTLHSAGLQWAALTTPLFDAWPDEDWLPEVLARAEMLRTRIRGVPTWPIAFEGGNLTIVLFDDGSWIRAWVGTAQRGLLVAFRPIDFEVRYLEGDGDAVYAAGLAVSWFLDCSVSLQGSRAHPHFEQRSTEPSRTVATTPYVYVPRPSFTTAVHEVASGARNPPRAHRVKGHVRELPAGRTPTAEARAQAPAYIRVNLAPDETFVRAHSRGGENSLNKLTIHLSKYSSLADALGLTRR